jgi:hypothetical protein
MHLGAISPLFKLIAGLGVGVAFAGAIAYTASHGSHGNAPTFNAGSIGTPSLGALSATAIPEKTLPEAHPTVPAPPTPVLIPAPTPADFSCPSGWAKRDNQYVRYLVCIPPGWAVVSGAVGPVGPVPTPAPGQYAQTGLPGSQLQIFNVQQSKLAGTPGSRLASGGILINIYVMQLLPSSDSNIVASILSPCAGKPDVIGGKAAITCSPPNVERIDSAVRTWRFLDAGKSLFIADVISETSASVTDQTTAEQVIKSVAFY